MKHLPTIVKHFALGLVLALVVDTPITSEHGKLLFWGFLVYEGLGVLIKRDRGDMDILGFLIGYGVLAGGLGVWRLLF